MAWCIKGVNRSASSAFSPDGSYMAAGTMAGAVDLHFSSSANLDIFEVDFVSDDRQLVLAGTAQSSERFNRISWSKGPPNSDEEYSLGLIAGGLVDGNIGLWNPYHLIRPETSDKAFVTNLTRHRGPVRGLEFNSITPNLLASGADEGEICIWDVANPSEPNHYPPLRGSGSATQGEISYLSWNSIVQHILASTSYNGTTVVWDLKKQKPVLSFSDSIRRRCSVLQWNPDIATQLIVASDEDGSPSLRLWDMRNIMSPVKEFVGHTKGVIAMSWCPFDSSYLLSCAKDNRTICWDTLSGEIVGELPAGTNWNFDVQWYSKIPGVISASSFDGKIGLYNVEGCGRYGAAESGINTANFRAPKWYRRKAGVSFGFGGKLVSFNSIESPSKSSEVYVNTLVTEKGLVGRSSEFEAAIQNGERSALKVFCDKKSQESESEEEREIWSFMKVMFAEDGSARSNLLSHLGFKLPAEESETIQDGLSDQVNALSLDDGMTNTEDVSEKKDSVLFAMDNGEDFFNNLPSPKADTPVATSKNEFVNNDPVNIPQEEVNGQEESADPAFDDAVQHALVVGDYKGAVEQCISAGRFGDALVIANVGGPSLWEHTRDQYLKSSHAPYLKIVVGAMVNRDLMNIANTRPLKSWKETLAIFCTFSQPEEWTLLCDTLASRLVAGGNTAAATLCYICAGNIDRAVEMWSKDLAVEHEGKTYVDRLQDLMEKTIVFALATGQKQFSASLCRLVEKYAEILASQGLLTTAMEYLNLLGTGELSTELTILRERIARSTEPEKEISQTYNYESSKLQTGSSYAVDQRGYGVPDPSQHYYQEPMPSQMQPAVPNSPYSDNYQQFNRGYNNPGMYQPTPQPNIHHQQPAMFVPSPANPAPVANFPLPPVNTQPPAKFVPANPPLLKNVEQYQQPSLGSQLYPNPSHQSGSPGVPGYGATPGQRMPQAIPTPQPRGFMPVNTPGVARPGTSPAQPSSPTQPAPMQAVSAPPAPPATVQTADTSNVPAQQKPVIATLTRLFNETSEALGGSRANPSKRREIEDNSKKLGALFVKLNSGDISKNAAEKLVQLCQALDHGDFATALQIQVLLTTSDWDECNFWLATLKRMIKTRQSVR